MRFIGAKTSIALLLVLLAGGYLTYRVVKQRRAQHEYEAAQEALERRDFKQASIHLEKCLEEWPDDHAVRLLAAQSARRRGDFAETRRHLNLYQEHHGPENERARELALLNVQRRDDPAEVDELFETFLKNPQTPEAYLALEVVINSKLKYVVDAYNLDMTLLEGPPARERERTERALELWFQQRSGTADRAQGFVWRGKLRFLTDQKAAVPDLREALKLDPDHFDARLTLALVLSEYDQREAAGHLEILRQREPGNERVCTMLASCRSSLGEFAEARAILDELLSANPDNAATLLERGKTALAAGAPKEAEGFLRKAVERAPSEPFNRLALSRCLSLIGKTEEAKIQQQLYNELESERVRRQKLEAEERRALWRRRLEQEMNQKR